MSNSSTHPTVSARDFEFQLFEVLDVESLTQRPEHEDHDRTSFSAVLGLAMKIAADKFQTHYRESDLDEPRIENGKVRVHPDIKPALEAFAEAGFMVADRPYEENGQQLPYSMLLACLACFQAANVATSSYNFLTISGAAVIREFGTEKEKNKYMRPMLDGRFLGTMCLSEPHAGSSLGDLKTRATLQSDGTYRLKGTKMWISAGEHELSENIIHLVLARIDGAPEGTRGISLFLVPRKRVNDDNSLGQDNDVTLVGLNHKMGYRGTVNTLLNFGDKGECEGFLIGEPHQGLRYMFHMMNEARISVGTGAAMLGYAGYLYSLEYAKQRPQGRLPGSKDPITQPVSIIQHADIRRMLITQKSYVEGALSLCLYAGKLVDDVRSGETDEIKENAEKLLDILTPIVKSWPSEFGLEANKLAMQILGGYGYTRDYPVEQYYRDNRLNLIHEGTHGIQAMDLVNRKIRIEGGLLFHKLMETMRKDIAHCKSNKDVSIYSQKLEQSINDVEQTTKQMQHVSDERSYSSNATMYLDMLGHLVIAWMWLRQADVASRAIAMGASGDEANFYDGKLAACGYFYEYELSRLNHWLPLLAAAPERFITTDPACL